MGFYFLQYSPPVYTENKSDPHLGITVREFSGHCNRFLGHRGNSSTFVARLHLLCRQLRIITDLVKYLFSASVQEAIIPVSTFTVLT